MWAGRHRSFSPRELRFVQRPPDPWKPCGPPQVEPARGLGPCPEACGDAGVFGLRSFSVCGLRQAPAPGPPSPSAALSRALGWRGARCRAHRRLCLFVGSASVWGAAARLRGRQEGPPSAPRSAGRSPHRCARRPTGTATSRVSRAPPLSLTRPGPRTFRLGGL